MKSIFNKINLQLFASDSDAGENTVVSGPSDNTSASCMQNDEAAAENANADAINGDTSAETLEQEFEKLIKGGKFESAFQKRTQNIIDKRFKTLKGLEEKQEELSPLLSHLSERYGTSDAKELLSKLQNDSKQNAEPQSNENTKDTADKSISDSLKASIISAKADLTYKRWLSEGEDLRELFPDFNFKAELKNPLFTTLLKNGASVKGAYTAVHSDDIIKSAVTGTAKRVREQTMKTILANGSRPAENGVHSSLGVVRKTDVSALTGSDIRSILKQVEDGRKIRF